MKEKIEDFTFDELWSDIETNFNWLYVHSAMTHLNWEWEMAGRKSVPTVEQLKASAKEDLLVVFNQKSGSVCSGGFCSYYEKGNLTLVFTLEDHCTEVFTNENMI